MNSKFFNIAFLGLISITLCFAACSKEAIEPDVQFSADKTTVSVDEEVTFMILGSTDGMSIYTGDDGHRFEDSHLAVVSGKDIESETVYLTAEGFEEFKNAEIISNQDIIDSIGTLVGRRFNSQSHPEFLITIFYDYEVAAARIAEIMEFFTVEKASYVPDNGFSKGVAIDVTAKNKEYKHKYSAPGTYTATLVATNTGRKDLKNSNTNLPHGDDYDRKYITKTVVITVE
ncbi:MAG TPA: hypothetical protein PKA53_09070 [Sphingobacterium sp.]|nr:hypothetical protein [Sphingobacterium sp.]